MKGLFFLSIQFLRGRGRKAASTISIISVIGVMLGVMVPIVVMSVMNGFQEEIRSKMLGMGGHINLVAPIKLGLTNYEPLIKTLKAEEDIVAVHPYAQMQGLHSYGEEFSPVLIHALDPKQLNLDPELEALLTPTEGQLLPDLPYRVMIGNQMQKRHFLEVGDRMTLIMLGKEKLAKSNLARAKTLRVEVVGIFHTGFQEYDSDLIVTSLSTLDQLFDTGNAVDSISIKVNDVWQAPAIKVSLALRYGKQFLIYSWQELHQSFFRALQLERNLLRLIMLFILLVAIFNVMSGQLIQISEHKKEIGILKTLGYTPGQILVIFMMGSLVVTGLGATLGAILGMMIAFFVEEVIWLLEFGVNIFVTIKNLLTGFFSEAKSADFELFPKDIYYLDKVPTDVSWLRAISFIALAIIFAITVCLFPSWKASKIKAMEVMRYE